MKFLVFVIFLLLVAILGVILYKYLHREQDKFIPRNYYESEFNSSKLSSKHSLRSGDRFFLIVAGIFLLISGGVWVIVVLLLLFLGGGDNGAGLIPYEQFFRKCVLVSLLLLVVAAFPSQTSIIVKTIFNKIYPLYNRHKITFIFCGILGVIGLMVSNHLSSGGCLWWECAPTRSFGFEELGLPATLFPADARVGDVSSYDYQIYQRGDQFFWWGPAGSVSDRGHYFIDKYSSSRSTEPFFTRRNQAIEDMENLGWFPFKPEGINYVSPLADQFYVDCFNYYKYYCEAEGQYQEFVLTLYIELDDKMTAQDFQQIVIYMDKQISKYLYGK